jgi:large subunit ribosomal protein L30
MSDKWAPGRLRVRLHKSPISYTAKARGTVRALGLHRMHETVEVTDNPATRGMVRSIRFLVEVEEVPAEQPVHAGPRRTAPKAPGRASVGWAAALDAAGGPARQGVAPNAATEGSGPQEERA